MPYLVDSVTMELNRHGADILLIVHPLLTVHRDVAGSGARHRHRRRAETDADAVRESWIHVELGHVDDPSALAADLRRVLDDLRVAMEDQRRMRSAARDLVEMLADAAARRRPRQASCSPGCRPATSPSSATAPTSWSAGDKPELKPVARHRPRHPAPRRGRTRSPSPRRAAGAARRGRGCSCSPSRPAMSTVYRPSYLDYVAVRRFSPETGEVIGEYRFLGLYTQAAYTESVTRIPVLRHKVDRVLDIAGVPADSHDGKALIEILEGYPREELFEISAEQLAPIALAVLGLAERKQVRLFLRPDAYGRYVSCLVYLPRDRYTTQVRLRAQEILRSAFGGASVDYSAMVGNSALARLHVVVHAEPGRPLAAVDQAALQARIAAAVRSWDEDLAAEAQRQLGAERRRSKRCGPAPTASPRPTRRTPRRPPRWPTWRSCGGCARSPSVRDPPFVPATTRPPSHQPPVMNGASPGRQQLAAPRLPAVPDHALRRAPAAAAHGARGAR